LLRGLPSGLPPAWLGSALVCLNSLTWLLPPPITSGYKFSPVRLQDAVTHTAMVLLHLLSANAAAGAIDGDQIVAQSLHYLCFRSVCRLFSSRCAGC
jgi:hypothetical protein